MARRGYTCRRTQRGHRTYGAAFYSRVLTPGGPSVLHVSGRCHARSVGYALANRGTFPGWCSSCRRTCLIALKQASDPTLIRIIFPTLRFTPKLQVARARTGLIQEVRWSTNGSQVMADIVLKQPGTVQHAARLQAPPRVVVDIARRNNGEVQKESEGAKGQGTVAAAPRVTDEHPQEGSCNFPSTSSKPHSPNAAAATSVNPDTHPTAGAG